MIQDTMKALRILPLLASLCWAAQGCYGNDDSSSSVGIAIEYVVESTGGAATVTQIEWTDTQGQTVTEMNPALPWSERESFASGDTARLQVTGSTGAASTITGRIQEDPFVVKDAMTLEESTCQEDTANCAIDLEHPL
jgi:hypothetical protein